MRSTERCERADKLSYPSPEDADAALERLHRLHAAGREDRREASAYLCQYGLDHWHLTSLIETYDRRPLHPSEIESAVAMLQRRVGGGVPAQSRRVKPPLPVRRADAAHPAAGTGVELLDAGRVGLVEPRAVVGGDHAAH